MLKPALVSDGRRAILSSPKHSLVRLEEVGSLKLIIGDLSTRIVLDNFNIVVTLAIVGHYIEEFSVAVTFL